MKIEFCDADGGDVISTKNDEELKNTINTITRIGTIININVDEDLHIYGYVDGVEYKCDEENNYESLKIYISKNNADKYFRTNNLLQELIKKVEELN